MILCVPADVSGQNACENYLKSNAKISIYKAELQRKYTQGIYNAFKKESLNAAEFLKQCAGLQQASALKQLNTNYQIAKFYLDGGSCTQAAEYFNNCRNLPLASVTQFKATGLTYKQKVSQLMQNLCSRPATENLYGSPVRSIHVTYAGKFGATTREKGVRSLVSKNTLDIFPYTSDEAESLSERLFPIADSLKAIVAVRNLVGGAAAMYFDAPYLFVDVNQTITHNAFNGQEQVEVDQESKYVSEGEIFDISFSLFKKKEKLEAAIVPLSSELLNRKVEIRALVAKLAKNYAIKLQDTGYIHVVYLFNSKFSLEGFQEYIEFCKNIHFRYPGTRIGYYNNYDQSVVTWLGTGQGTLAHELVHLFLAIDFPNAPNWLNEGMASLQEETSTIGPEDNWRLIYIQSFRQKYKTYLPVQDIVNKSEDFSELDAIIGDCFARYLCFYLNDQEKLTPLYQRFRASKEPLTVVAQIQLIENVYGKSFPEMEQDFYAWLDKRTVPSKWAATGFVKFIDKAVQRRSSRFRGMERN